MTGPEAFTAPIRNPSTRTDREHGYVLPCATFGCMGEDGCVYCGAPFREQQPDVRTRATDCADSTTP